MNTSLVLRSFCRLQARIHVLAFFRILEVTCVPWLMAAFLHLQSQQCLAKASCCHLSGSLLVPPSSTWQNHCDDTGFTWIIWDNISWGHLISNLNFICNLNSPLPCKEHIHRFWVLDVFVGGGRWHSSVFHIKPQVGDPSECGAQCGCTGYMPTKLALRRGNCKSKSSEMGMGLASGPKRRSAWWSRVNDGTCDTKWAGWEQRAS